jgi:putative chitinase
MHAEVVRALYPRAAEAHTDQFAERAPALLDRFRINGPTRLEFFLAQIGHESGGLTITTENMNYRAKRIREVWPKRFPTEQSARPYEGNPEHLANAVYAGRMGNGPPESGDGWRYRGRGYIQITGRDGYQSVGDIAELDLVSQPDLAADPENALLVACSFWQWKRLNDLSDSGDFEKVTRRINGGTTGMTDRRAWLNKVRRTLASPPMVNEQPPAEKIIAIQRALQSRGYKEVGAADGIIGPNTIAAVTRFRSDQRLPVGQIDDELTTALELA